MNTKHLTQSTAKVIVTPMHHESHGRVTRRTWVAGLTQRDSDKAAELCEHTVEGHRTIAAAVRCGKVMWRRLDV